LFSSVGGAERAATKNDTPSSLYNYSLSNKEETVQEQQLAAEKAKQDNELEQERRFVNGELSRDVYRLDDGSLVEYVVENGNASTSGFRFLVKKSDEYKRMHFLSGQKVTDYLGTIYIFNAGNYSFETEDVVMARNEREQAEKAERTAAAEAKKKADAEALEKKQNPNNLNRSAYKEITVEDFSFDMVAGNLAVGSKVCFNDNFLRKPTGTEYTFKNVNFGLTLSSNHNFVRDIPESCFTGMIWGSYVPSMTRVKVFVTVKKTGQAGTCSVDIVEW
jgi:hypothetical protein